MQVTLVGDSIRRSYQPYVQEELSGLANVWGPEDNGRTSENILNHLKEWVLSRGPEVVHLNAGLHDFLRPVDGTENAVPLAQYRLNVEAVLKTTLEETRARVIWATTTPVNEKWQSRRTEADVVAYNEAAVEISRRLGVEVNNLNRIVTEAGRDRLLTPDGVHFTEQGQRVLGKAVADFIRGPDAA